MDFSNKCAILGGLYSVYRMQPSWAPFCNTQDIGLPLAYMLMQELVETNDEGEAYVEETWEAYCTYIQIDSEADYDSLEETFLASPAITFKED